MTVARADGWLRFERAGRAFVVAAERARAVVVQPQVARVPNAPAVLVGLIAWRGNVVPLLEPGEASSHGTPGIHAAVLLASESGEIAVAADAVDGWDDAPRDGDARFEPDARWALARAALRPGGDPVGGTHLDR